MSAQINYIWFGNGALGALEKFNIYSWKALGHEVTVYASKWDTSAHTASSLGLKDVEVVDLYKHVAADDKKLAKVLPKTRELLKEWLEAAKKTPPKAPNEQVYNVVDLT